MTMREILLRTDLSKGSNSWGVEYKVRSDEFLKCRINIDSGTVEIRYANQAGNVLDNIYQ